LRGDLQYMAPELLQQMNQPPPLFGPTPIPVTHAPYNQQADMYSLGVIMSQCPVAQVPRWWNMWNRLKSHNPLDRPYAFQVRNEAIQGMND